jgi:signal peptidase II
MTDGLIRQARAFVAHDMLRLATLVALAAFLADWASKSWALHALQYDVIPLGGLNLALERNDAFAFSAGSGSVPPWVVIAVRLIALAAVIFLSRRVVTHSRRYAAGFALLIGGGLGNAADLMFRNGAVVDFIAAGPYAVSWGGEVAYLGLVFNLADIAILLGIGLIGPQIQAWALAGQRRLARFEQRWLGARA